ncbi:J domain-containing protein [Haloarcula sp. S1CR25-12]|uniref:J domain-containing protein n=1 Tax=Haloarcula saliterrae TaxID=2950534 RepID=A0ABU2FBI2_9EURY|nr:J domain-containing protein [Haloarcula sp. S1CR25-12]MDS0259586.1 J domain-containing protein [Haloarcula sp. S1CR25-12]
MQYDRLITGVAVVFAGLTAVLTVVGLLASPSVLFLALMFGASTYLMYYHVSGKMAASVYARVEQRAATDGRGGFGAGPREEWEPPRDGRARRTAERVRQERTRRQRARQGTKQRRRVQQSTGPSPAEAYDRLGLDPSADESAVKQAYRERVKETHPDTDSGSEREFKRVKAAYERLSDD